jgi:two-component system sensor histidine kinase TctE
MLLPAIVLALVLGLGGAWVIHGVVQTTSDRLLDGSVLAIAERLGVDEDNKVTVDLPRAALGMLESQAQDRIYYSVIYNGTLVTGYRDLPRVELARLRPGVTYHWDTVMRGSPVRMAAEARRQYGKPDPVLVQVAQTRDARRALEFQLLGGLAALEGGLLGLVGVLAWLAIGSGLRPLTQLSAEIGRRAAPGAVSLHPLKTTQVPKEALAPVLAFNALLQRLAGSMGAVRRFTADASHQMGTPLAIMRMHLDLIRRHYRNQPAPPEVGAALDDIGGATERLEHLLAQLLVLARAKRLCEKGQTGARRLSMTRIAATSISASAVWTLNS